MTIFAFGFFAFLLVFIEANDVAENQLAELRNWSPSGNFLWASKCDFQGQDLNAANPPWTQNIEDCGTSCLNNPQCVRFTWNTVNGKCYHKRMSGTGAAHNNGAVCGHIPGRGWQAASPFFWDDNCNFDGNDITNFKKESTVKCGVACFENLECDHFTWTRGDGMCYLKKGEWTGNTPTPYPNAQCAYLPGRGLWKASGNFLWDENCDFGGKDLKGGIFRTSSTTDCANVCFAINPECDHFTWAIGTCYLKKGEWTGNTPAPYFNAQCGFIPVRQWKEEATFLWRNNCVFGGQDLPDPSTKRNIQECGNACLGNKECDHFSWSSRDSMCYLKKGQWPDNSPSADPKMLCGFIPGRAWVTSGKIVWDYDCDFPGQDINNEPDIYEWKAMFGPSVKYGKKPPKTNKEDCGTSCLENPKCDHFSWEPSTTNCYHKIWSGKGPTIKNGGRCGYIPDRIHIEPVMLKDKDAWDVTHPVIRWQDYCYFPDGKCLNCQHQGTSTIWIPKEKCGQECLENPKCSRFNWDGREFDRDGVSARCFHLEWSDSLARPKGSARCGFISDRQSARKISWTTNDKIVSASNCDAPESATTIDVVDAKMGLVGCGKDCSDRKGTKCTAFVLSGTSCRMYNVAIPEKWLIPDDFRSCGFIKSA